jgi:putative membrane protein
MSTNESNSVPIPLLVGRSLIGGVLMGLANLVPGISGGTMLLAAGIYPRFINAIAEVTTLRLRAPSIAVLSSVVVAAGLAILLLAGTVKGLVVDHRWIMYSLFIGLTLGGVPIVWKMVRPARKATWIGAMAGFIVMAVLAYSQQTQSGAGGGNTGIFMLFLAGVAGASAMILPGVSGGYLLLVLGQYLPILSAIDAFKLALKGGEMGEATQIALHIGIPVGLGVLVGVVGVSNLLRLLLKRFEKATLGVLLGLLLGAVVGLWPFQTGVLPQVDDVVKGETMTEGLIAELDPEDYPTRYFSPSVTQVGGVFAGIAVGFLITFAIARIGGREEE